MFVLSIIILTFVPEMKKLIYIIVPILFATACSKNGIVERLNEVDSLVVKGLYDSANFIMSNVDTFLIKDVETRVHYYLLHQQLACVLNKDDNTDVLDNFVIPYYNKVVLLDLV